MSSRRHAILPLCLLAGLTMLPGCRAADERDAEEDQRALSALSEGAQGTEAEATEAPDEATPGSSEYRCVTPPIPIPRPGACVRGRDYPRCKWNLPHALESRGSYRRWRNTIPEHRWGRPGLVSLLLATAAEFHDRFADQVLAIGDLDAPGPRHQTHDRGVDVDIYLPGAMITENVGGGRYVENYEAISEDEVEGLRQRVEELARILAVCSGGQLRIYYNDDVVVERFNRWFAEEGFASPYGEPMQMHNDLHRFHFHMSVTEDLAPLPRAPGLEEPDPIMPIPTPPAIAGVTRAEMPETPEVPEEDGEPVPGSALAPVPTAYPVPIPTADPVPVPTADPVPVPTADPVPVPTADPAPAPAP